MFQIKQSEATAIRRRIPVLLVDITDGFTPETGVVTPTINISKNGATVATGAGTWAEIGNGQYYYEFTSGEVSDLGWIAVNIEKATVSRDYNAIVQVMAYDAMDSVRLGLTALPNAAAGANGGLPTGNASGQVTMAGTATGAITSSSFAAGAIDASAIATDAITSAELSATAITEIAAGVWDEAYASHTTAGTFGKLMDLLRKANLTTEATVSASGAPANSSSFFRTSLTGADNFYNNQEILFTSGTLTGQSAVISVYTSTNGTVQLSDSMTTTPTAGDSFVVLGTHVWTREQIADGFLLRLLDRSGNGTGSTSNERTVLSALRYLRNKIDISASTMTVTTEDDTTTAWTAALTTTSGLNPVTTVDPS